VYLIKNKISKQGLKQFDIEKNLVDDVSRGNFEESSFEDHFFSLSEREEKNFEMDEKKCF